jgi:hypothetical protein
MKTGIYVSGLGQSFQEESVEKYAARFMNEFNSSNTGMVFTTKTEKITYGEGLESTVVSILKTKDGNEELVYKFYEYKYNEILTGRFTGLNILLKNLILFWIVIKKTPRLIYRFFKPDDYSHPGQTLYLFFIFLLIATAILFVLPVAFGVIINFLGTEEYRKVADFIKNIFPFLGKWGIDREFLSKLSEIFLSITALLIIIIPSARVVITSLATEFVCANNYLEIGAQSQEVHGNLDQLVEYIAENEKGTKIHYHSYSFGSVVSLDLLFPFGTVPSKNVQQLSEAIITIGTPVEFIKAYYKGYYNNRNMMLDGKLLWLNVYSVQDALATNFRKDRKNGPAEFGLEQNSMKPVNINYEISNVTKNSFVNALLLGGIKAHSVYWHTSTSGLSCLRLIYNELDSRQLL